MTGARHEADRASPRANDASSLGVALAVVFVAVLVVAVVPFGSTGPFAGYIATLATAVLTIGAVLFRPMPASTRWIERTAWILALGIAAYVGMQATGMFGLLPSHPVWGLAAEVLGEPLRGFPALAPADAVAALPFLLSPFLMFVAGLRIAQSERTAILLLEAIGIFGGMVAMFGLAQFALAPDFLLLIEKTSYRDSVTGVFVNRNTAATFFGSTALVLIALLQWHLRHALQWRAFVSAVLDPRGRRASRKPMFYAFLFAVCVLALLLTKSRAGIACSSGAIFVCFCLSATGRDKGRIGWLATILAAAFAIGAVVLLFGGQAIQRAAIRGMNDNRFCILPDLWSAVRDTFPFGTGPGSFRLVFQSFRDPACGIYGQWLRAHNFFLEGSIAIGAVFWIAMATSLGCLAIAFLTGFRKRRRYRFMPVLGIALVLLLVTHALIDFSLQIPGMALTAAAILALCVSVSLGRNARNEEAETREIEAFRDTSRESFAG